MIYTCITGRSDSVTPCCGSSVGGAHAIACHCRQEAADTLYSMKEVSYHCDTQSCWVVVENAVYDLTDFIYDVSAAKYPLFIYLRLNINICLKLRKYLEVLSRRSKFVQLLNIRSWRNSIQGQ